MSRHARPTARRRALWIAGNATVLAALTLWLVARVYVSSPAAGSHSGLGPGPGTAPAVAAGSATAGSASASPTPPPVPSRDVFLRPSAPYFGLATPRHPGHAAN